MRVVLVHDYLFEYGGAERVLEALHELWPQAPVYTSFVDWEWVKKNKKEWLTWKIIPSWYDKVLFKKTLCSPMRFLAPWIWEGFDLRDFDLVISSSAWFICKGVITHPDTIHICYCHTPPRYLYGYPESGGKKSWLAKLYAFFVNPGMRRYDYLTSQRVDYFITNSQNVERRIKKFYRREAEVIYPPIEVPNSNYQSSNKTKIPRPRRGEAEGGQKPKSKNDYYLMVNRLVWPKRVDLAIAACKKLGLNLKIVGQGKAEEQLKQLAGNNPKIEFLGYVPDKKLSQLYKECKAVLYLAQEEDFGITPVEAAGWGKPVIALRSGGVVESVQEGKTGFFIDQPKIQELIGLLQKFEQGRLAKINPKSCRTQAQKFSKDNFKRKIQNFIKDKLNK
jgi:glycosyltransferase involved in cell wall biosynthesis